MNRNQTAFLASLMNDSADAGERADQTISGLADRAALEVVRDYVATTGHAAEEFAASLLLAPESLMVAVRGLLSMRVLELLLSDAAPADSSVSDSSAVQTDSPA